MKKERFLGIMGACFFSVLIGSSVWGADRFSEDTLFADSRSGMFLSNPAELSEKSCFYLENCSSHDFVYGEDGDVYFIHYEEKGNAGEFSLKSYDGKAVHTEYVFDADYSNVWLQDVSGDGKYVILGGRENSGDGTALNILLADLKKGSCRILKSFDADAIPGGTNGLACFSPDGESIAFGAYSGEDEAMGRYTCMDLEGREIRSGLTYTIPYLYTCDDSLNMLFNMQMEGKFMAIHRADGHTTDLPNLQSVVTNRSCDQFIMADREGGIWFYSFETDVPVRVCDGEDLVMLTSDELLYDTTFAVGNSVSVYGNRRLMTDTLDHLFFAAERAEGEADLYYIDSFSGASVRSVDRIDLGNGEGYFVRNMGIQREGGCILRVDEEKSRIVYVSQDTVRLADLTSGYIKELSPLSGASSFLIDKKMKNIMIRRGNDEVECIRMSDLESKTKKIKNAISDSFFMVSTDSFEGGGYFTKDALVLIDFKGKKRTISCSMELAETLSGEMPVVIRNMTYWTMSGSESYKDGKNCVLIGDSKLAVWPSDGTNEGAERSDQKEHFLLKLLRAILEA